MLFQPDTFAAGVRLRKVIVGGVASRFTVRGDAGVVNPALFVQEPLNVVPALLVDNDCGAVQITGVLMESVPEVVMVTLLVYQPLLPNVPEGVRMTPVGAVVSRLTVSGAAFVVRPAAFVQEPLKVVPLLSVESVCRAVQVTGVLMESVPVVVMVTLLVYQPLLPSVPDGVSTAVGPVLSILIPF